MITRRHFVGALAAAGAETTRPLKLSIFSKHLLWARLDEMAKVAKDCGFDGVDLAVRKGGHVEPERVATDLPRYFEAVRKAGLDLPMITTGIVDASTPYAEQILQTASALGIRNYRWGGFQYNNTRPIPDQLEALKPRVRELAALNRRHHMTAMYHTHSGMEVGAPIWDLYLLLKDIDPKQAGINYDIAHATIEGGLGGWIRSFQLAAPYTRGVALKDFRWARNSKGEWFPEWRPAGEGMVNFPRFFAMLKASRFDGPVQIHYEYEPLDIAKMKRDLEYYRRALAAA